MKTPRAIAIGKSIIRKPILNLESPHKGNQCLTAEMSVHAHGPAHHVRGWMRRYDTCWAADAPSLAMTS